MTRPNFSVAPGPMVRAPVSFRSASFDAFSSLLLDELTPIAKYMAQEMNINSRGQAAKQIKELNGYSADKCIDDFTKLPIWQQLLGLGLTPKDCLNNQMTYRAAAFLAWTEKVMQNAPWDHKPIIARRFNQRKAPSPQYWHAHGGTEYYYDVWSNLHYGYVGVAVGFGEAVLLDGAGLEQIGSDIWRKQRPQQRGGVSGLRAFDDPADRLAISMGMRLYKQKPAAVTDVDLLSLVVGSAAITTRPLQP